ncbi:MAG: 2-enoate reductase, partial [Lachnospiraceae bacterium]|nr:2-enoate reductase [Lachnospiraceae bacterium]
IEMLDHPNDGGNFQHMKGLQAELDKYGVEISFETRAAEIDERGVVCEKGGETVRFDADHVIYAVGRRPVVEETYALAACAPEFYPIGDCLAAKNIMNATSQAYKVAAAI